MAEALANDAAKRARTALMASPVFALRDLDVAHDDGRLLITGVVRTFYHKQLAQEVVRTVADGLQVVNSVAVE